jgi:hypothetical protein
MEQGTRLTTGEKRKIPTRVLFYSKGGLKKETRNLRLLQGKEDRSLPPSNQVIKAEPSGSLQVIIYHLGLKLIYTQVCQIGPIS